MMHNTSYVTDDGTYGTGDILLFHPKMLSTYQWRLVDCMSDNDRYRYVKACLEQNDETIAEIEEWYQEAGYFDS